MVSHTMLLLVAVSCCRIRIGGHARAYKAHNQQVDCNGVVEGM